MESIIESLTSNPMYMVGAAVLGLVILVFLLKKVFKIAIIVIVLGLGYVGYVYFTDGNPKRTLEKQFKSGKEKFEDVDKATKDMRKDLDKVLDDVDKQLKEKNKKRK